MRVIPKALLCAMTREIVLSGVKKWSPALVILSRVLERLYHDPPPTGRTAHTDKS